MQCGQHHHQNECQLYKYMVCKSGVLPLGVGSLDNDRKGQDRGGAVVVSWAVMVSCEVSAGVNFVAESYH